MRRIRTAGVGVGLTLSAAAGWADGPPAAARFGVIRGLDEPAGSVTARGQVNGPPSVAMPGVGPSYLVGGQQPTAQLGQPKATPSAPTVTEQRGAGLATTPPAAWLGTTAPVGGPVVYGQPVPAGTPVVVGGPLPGFSPTGQPFGTIPQPDLDPPLCGPGPTGPLSTLTSSVLGPSRVAGGGPERLRLDADLLLWYVRSGRVPPLVTTSSPQYNGVIGQGDTRVLFGGDTLDRTFHTGGRFGGVYWLGCDQRWGVDGNVFFLAQRGWSEQYVTSGSPLLARPFVNVNQGINFSEVVAAPGLAVGSVAVTGGTSMWGAEINARRYLTGSCNYRLDGLIGFRYLNLSENLTVTEAFNRIPGAPLDLGVPNALFGTISDSFRTENHFYGPQVGLTGELRRGRYFVEGRTTIAFGTVYQSLQVDGTQSIQFTTGPGQYTGGLLALPGANIGTFTQNKFAVLPEVGLKIGCFLTPNLRVGVGYNFMYLSSVLRPGDQIDTGLDVTRVPNFTVPGATPLVGSIRPAPRMATSDMFVQGINLSLTWTW